MKLHGYYRSAASYRVRIALNLKEVKAEEHYYRLRKGEQRASDYLALNPQGFVPTLETGDGTVITQSLAIIEWLEETHPQPPLLPNDAAGRARIRAFAMVLACDTHPIQNLGVLNRLRAAKVAEGSVTQWAADTNEQGLAVCERLILLEKGPFCFGAAPTLADICLVPQLYNARRFKVDVTKFRRLIEAEAASNALPAFAAAAPERQPDYEP